VTSTVGDIVEALDARFPPRHAEPWDRVGLAIGDPSHKVTKVLVALDAEAAAVEEARAVGAELLVTHHPPYLDPPADPYLRTGASGATTWEPAGISVASYHTNLDRSDEGSAALAEVLGLEPGERLAPFAEELGLVTAYAPREAADAVLSAAWAAGAGEIGAYRRCAFESEGTGRFDVPAEGDPYVGTAGSSERAAETRLEFVCPRHKVDAVMRAATKAHPYEEPLVLAGDVKRASLKLGYGRVCRSDPATTAESLATHAARTLGAEVRLWGDPSTSCERVAVSGGAGSTFVEAAHASGAQALICGEVRYHSALEATAAGTCVIELGHDVSEWPLVDVLFGEVARTTRHTAVEVVRARRTRAWRTLRGTGDGAV
jgi:dinuclear metal center YbgI/SA1388 family protein